MKLKQKWQKIAKRVRFALFFSSLEIDLMFASLRIKVPFLSIKSPLCFPLQVAFHFSYAGVLKKSYDEYEKT